jgi:hypothetical protein
MDRGGAQVQCLSRNSPAEAAIFTEASDGYFSVDYKVG